MDIEQKLDKGIKALLGRGPSDYPVEDWVSLREQFRLLILCPGKFVAYRNHYQGEGEERRLTRREILHTARSLTVVQNYIAALPEEEQQSIRIEFIDKARTTSLAK